MRILVTGANGYLGRGIVNDLLSGGNEIVAVDLKMNGFKKQNNLVTKECSIFELNDPFSFFNKPDIVVHLAWRDGFIHNSNNHINELPKHVAFLESLMKSGVNKVTVMGSMHEVGFYEGSINEDTPCNPLSLYGIAKNCLREVVAVLAQKYHVHYQWLRAYYIVSNSPNGSSIFSKIIQSDLDGKIEFPFTSGTNQYDFLNYEDFCYMVSKTVVQDKINGIINICSGKPEKLCNRVEDFIKENNLSIELKYGAFPDRSYDSKAVWGDSRIIESILK